MMKDFASKYDLQTVEARDFTVVINKLPDGYKEYTNENTLKFGVWMELQDSIKLAKQLRICPFDMDPTIININVVMKNQKVNDHAMILNEKCEEIELLYTKMEKLRGESRHYFREKINDETETLMKILDKHFVKKKNEIKLMQSDQLKDQDESFNS